MLYETFRSYSCRTLSNIFFFEKTIWHKLSFTRAVNPFMHNVVKWPNIL